MGKKKKKQVSMTPDSNGPIQLTVSYQPDKRDADRAEKLVEDFLQNLHVDIVMIGKIDSKYLDRQALVTLENLSIIKDLFLKLSTRHNVKVDQKWIT